MAMQNSPRSRPSVSFTVEPNPVPPSSPEKKKENQKATRPKTPLSHTENVRNYAIINTPPLVLLSHRYDKRAKKPGTKVRKTDFYVSSPDTYPRLTVFSLWTDDRDEFKTTVPLGTVIRLSGTQVNKDWDDDPIEQEMTRRPKPGGPGHLNVYRHASKWWYIYGDAPQDREEEKDWEEVEACRRLYAQWKGGDESLFIEEVEQKRWEKMERSVLDQLEREERRMMMQLEEARRNEEMAFVEQMLADAEGDVDMLGTPTPVLAKEELREKAKEAVKQKTEAEAEAETRSEEQTDLLREQGKIWMDGKKSKREFWKLDGLY